MIASVPEILITGADDTLLAVRAHVLESGSFVVSTALAVEGLESVITGGNIPALIVICSSYGKVERATMRKSAERAFPGMPILTLLRASETGDDFAGETLPQAAGPAGLIAAAHRLIDGTMCNVGQVPPASPTDLHL